jgi:hypothetical protein
MSPLNEVCGGRDGNLGKRLQGPAVDSNYQVVQNIYHDTDCALTVKLYSANRTAFI